MDFYRGIIVPSSNPTSKILKADPFCMLTAIFTSVMDLNTLLSQVPALILINYIDIIDTPNTSGNFNTYILRNAENQIQGCWVESENAIVDNMQPPI